MYNVAVEQIISVTPPKKSILYKVILIIACILAVTTIPSTGLFVLLLLVVLVLFTIFVFRYYKAEYEYSLVDGELTIERIMAKTSRKRCGVYSVSKATLVARPDSNDALRLEHMDYRTSRYISEDADNNSIVVVYTYNSKNEMERLYIQPDERMLQAIAGCVGRDVYKID